MTVLVRVPNRFDRMMPFVSEGPVAPGDCVRLEIPSSSHQTMLVRRLHLDPLIVRSFSLSAWYEPDRVDFLTRIPCLFLLGEACRECGRYRDSDFRFPSIPKDRTLFLEAKNTSANPTPFSAAVEIVGIERVSSPV